MHQLQSYAYKQIQMRKDESGPTDSHGMKVVREGENTKSVKG